ncbi:OmpA family protein [Antarcticibacterium sp. 1MA-6-2]|uniref:OmpA family protein n=1 Tax=Antarcticibacterium sp. 1MA-6-2 TaxID=2908210 RepID=UPI001F199E78|nr:OmpA family protein [Antarcticibacterium sp. 1MA-6-2]UJH90368.1 OmpA family protein [Antarcticibacterium sp. 1MA-6-2]
MIKFDNNSIIAPLMEKEKYLPEVFTLEFDAYFNDVYHTYQTYSIRFFPGVGGAADVKDGYLYPLVIRMNGAEINKTEAAGNKSYEKHLESNGKVPGWKHIAISYNKRAMKVFIDEERILNIPNIELDPSVFSIQSYTIGEMTSAIKNIRIAEGGKKLYDRIVADGKFITRGITFDVNKSTLKPESMGVINEIATLMKEHQDLKFSIEGHTDSDGEESSNLKLSEQRANAVREALISFGVDGLRLQAKGLGETVPVSNNSLPEGKANNRRVEFVKI